jgi:hypothetical protein
MMKIVHPTHVTEAHYTSPLEELIAKEGLTWELWQEHRDAIRNQPKVSNGALIIMDGMPSAGKTTAAEALNNELKTFGIRSELIPEYARGAVLQENAGAVKNTQSYVFGKQWSWIRRNMNNFSIAVADAEARNSLLYPTLDTDPFEAISWLRKAELYNTIHFFLIPRHELTLQGRKQNNIAELYELGLKKRQLLDVLEVPYVEVVVDTQEQSHMQIILETAVARLQQLEIVRPGINIGGIDWEAYRAYHRSKSKIRDDNNLPKAA